MTPPRFQWSKGKPEEVGLTLTGRWTSGQTLPGWRSWCRKVRAQCRRDRKVFRMDLKELEEWDSYLLVYLNFALTVARENELEIDWQGIPDKIASLLRAPGGEKEKPLGKKKRKTDFFWGNRLTESLGGMALEGLGRMREAFAFIGLVLLSIPFTLRRMVGLRGLEWLRAMKQAGADAVPIVGLISFLTGLILAFQAALVLREYGADIFVANLVGLSMLREMAPLMTAVILAGRTGAAYAAHLGNMKVTEEMDALRVTGISPVEFLVVPRILALAIMAPLLVIYSNALGVLGGMMVAQLELDISPAGFLAQFRSGVGLMDAAVGHIKSVAFGLIVGIVGCLRGMQCEGGSVAVGRATTSAVVTSIFLIVVADAVFAVIFSILEW